MNMNKLVSIIIAAYNHEKYIQETINACINQTYENLELIIIDDGSKDSTYSKIQEMADLCKKRFKNFICQTQENQGTCITLNRLISMANGEYVYMNASDDVPKPETIKKEVEFLENNPDYALCVGDNELIDSESKVCYWDKNHNIVYDVKQAYDKTFAQHLKRAKKFNFNSEKFGTYQSLYLGNYIPNGYTIRNSVIKQIKFILDAPLEDWYLMLQISKKYKMKYLDEILYSYRQHSGQTICSKKHMLEMEKQTNEYEKKILDKIDENTVFPEVIEVKNKGALYKRQGIPYIFEIKSYSKYTNKIKKLYIFNIKVFEYEIKNL